MRLPVTPQLATRDGASNRDGRLTNVLSETDEDVTLAVVRPALEAVSSNTGNGNGLVEFDGVLISAFGTVLGYGSTPTSIGAVLNATYDFAAGPL